MAILCDAAYVCMVLDVIFKESNTKYGLQTCLYFHPQTEETSKENLFGIGLANESTEVRWKKRSKERIIKHSSPEQATLHLGMRMK